MYNQKIMITALFLLGIYTADMFAAAAAAAATRTKPADIVGLAPAVAGAESVIAAAAYAGLPTAAGVPRAELPRAELPRAELPRAETEAHAQTVQEQAKAFEQRCHNLHAAVTNDLVPLTVTCRTARSGFEWILTAHKTWVRAKRLFMGPSGSINDPRHMAQGIAIFNKTGAEHMATCAANGGNEFVKAEQELRAAFDTFSKELSAIINYPLGLTGAEIKLTSEIKVLVSQAKVVLAHAEGLRNFYSLICTPIGIRI